MKYIYNIALMGISSSIMFFAALLLYRNIERKYARWYYAMLVTATLLLIIPLQTVISLPKMMWITVPDTAISETAEAVTTAAPQVTVFGIIFALWATVASVMLIRVFVEYAKTYNLLLKSSTKSDNNLIFKAYNEVATKMKLRRSIEVRTSAHICTPMMFGIIKPKIFMPECDFTYDELVMVMSHELIHYKHKDLLIKFIASIGICVHWFNPVAYLLKKSLNAACELCCDESVLEMLDLKDKKAYGRLIISVIETTVGQQFSYTTAMAATEQGIKKRLLRIAEFRKPSISMRITGVMLFVSLFVCSVTALGVDFAKKALPEEATEKIAEMENTPIVGNSVSELPTEQPSGSIRPISGMGHTTEKPTQSASNSVQPAITENSVQAKPIHTPQPSQNSVTPLDEPERNTSVHIEINESANFNDTEISSDNSKRISASADESAQYKVGEEIKAYIKVQGDGSYELVRTE